MTAKKATTKSLPSQVIRVHPGPNVSYPEGTPKLERLPREFLDQGHSLDTWRALVEHPAITLAAEIFKEAHALKEKLSEWMDDFGFMDDPGKTAIHDCKHIPRRLEAYLSEYGTSMRFVRDHFRGLAWAVGCALDMTRDCIPDVEDKQHTVANVARLLGMTGQGKEPMAAR